MSPELEAAYHHLYDVVWNKIATLDIDVPGYNGISYDDTNLLDEAAAKVERLLVAESSASCEVRP